MASEQVERGNLGCVAMWRRLFEVVSQGALLAFFVFVETSGALLTSRTLKPAISQKVKPLPTSMTVTHSALSIFIGLSITACTAVYSEKSLRAIPRAFGKVFQWKAILNYSFVAASFTTQGVFSYLAYSKLDAGLKKILDQLRMPAVAALGTVVVGRRYSIHEWLALMIVFLAICSFYMADVEHDAVTELHTQCRYPATCFEQPSYDICARRVDGPTIVGAAVRDRRNANGIQHDITTFPVTVMDTDRIGVVFSGVAIVFNCMGALFSEKLLKKDAATPFPTQKVQMEVTGFLVSIFMSFFVPLCVDPRGGKAIWWKQTEVEGSGKGFFQGFSHLTLMVITINMFQTWMGGIIIKQFSALIAKLATCFTVVLTVITTGTILKPCEADPLPVTMFALTLIITSATALFGTVPKDKAAEQAAPPQATITRESLLANEPVGARHAVEPLTSNIQLQVPRRQ
mmetsp:Transcript_9724/g.17100  ORF Transcript_9724/g.17100 Transcript_9724/m.17100 type:complete len:458 (-) Transcript_9724:66-1439(-)